MSLTHLKTSPFAVPFYDADDEMLQHWFIFCVCVAGKSAAQMEKKVDAFLGLLRDEILPRNPDLLPFSRLARISRSETEALLRRVKMGRYGILAKTLQRSATRQLLDPDWLRRWSVDRFMNIPGIGPKTARFFLMYTRRDFRGAVLDTHVLKWLDEQQGTPPIYKFPKSTPQNPRRYAEIEEMFLAVCDATNQTPADFDFQIWKSRARPQHV